MDSSSHSTVFPDKLKHEMMRELQREGVADWYTLGMMLNIPKPRLDIIEFTHRNPNRRIIELLCEWFNHEDNPSWEKLGKALIDTHCHQDQGRSILKKYCPHVLNSYSPPSRVSHRPVLLTRSGDHDTPLSYSTLPDHNTENSIMLSPSLYSPQLRRTPINNTIPHGYAYNYPYFSQHIPTEYPSFHSSYIESFHGLPEYHPADPSIHLGPLLPRYRYPPTLTRCQPTTQPIVTETALKHDKQYQRMIMDEKHRSTDAPIVTGSHSNLKHDEIIKHESTRPNELQVSTFDTVSIMPVISTIPPGPPYPPEHRPSYSSSHLPSHPPSFSHLRPPFHLLPRYECPPTPTTQPVVTRPDLKQGEQMPTNLIYKSTDTPIVTEPDESDLKHGEQIIMDWKHQSTDPSTSKALQTSTAETDSIPTASQDHLKMRSSSMNSLPQATLSNACGEIETLSKDHPLSFCSYSTSPNPLMLYTTPSLPIHIQDYKHREAFLEKHKCNLNYTRLISQFGSLKYDVQEVFEKERVSAEKIKRYLSRMKSSPVNVHDPFSFLEENSPELEKASTIDEIFIFLNKYMSFDNCTLLESLVDKFLPQSNAGTLILDYNQSLESFFRSCPSEMLAMVSQENLSTSPHLHENSVSIHFGHPWETRPAQHLKDFQQREFHHSYIPPSSLKTLMYKKHSIFIVWETTSKVIQELSRDCVKRFSHFRRQGVLQFIIGTLEMDFSTSKSGPPEVFRIEESKSQLIRTDSKSALHGSMKTLQSEQSQDSRKTGESGRTGESGYGSGHATSIDNLLVAISSLPVPDIYPEIEVLSSFSSGEKGHLSVHKGQKVRCLHMYGEWACVMSEENKCGYIPSNILETQTRTVCKSKQPNPLSYSPTISEESISVHSELLSSQPFVIVRRKVSLSELNLSASVAPTTSSEIKRSDTPPILTQVEALEISLSSDRNSEAVDPDRSPDQKGQIISLKQNKTKEFVQFVDDEDTNSLSKSLKQDLHQYREEPETKTRIPLFRKLRNFFSRERRSDSESSNSEIQSSVSSKTLITIGSETASKKSHSISKMEKDTHIQPCIVVNEQLSYLGIEHATSVYTDDYSHMCKLSKEGNSRLFEV